jgi:hypothetical protein
LLETSKNRYLYVLHLAHKAMEGGFKNHLTKKIEYENYINHSDGALFEFQLDCPEGCFGKIQRSHCRNEADQ